MPVAAPVALAAGSLAIGAAGLGLQVSAQQKASAAAKQQAAIAGQQSQLSAEAVGKEEDINQQASAASYAAAAGTGALSKQILGYQQNIQDIQNQAMNVSANRMELEIARQSQRARSMALATATAQGAAKSGGSALGGAYGQVGGQTGVNFAGVEGQRQAGNQIAGLNRQITGANVDWQDIQTQLAFTNAQLQTQKSQLIQQYAKQGADLQTLYSGYGSQIASAGGQAAIGGAMLGGANLIFQGGNNLYKAFQGPPALNTFGIGGVVGGIGF